MRQFLLLRYKMGIQIVYSVGHSRIRRLSLTKVNENIHPGERKIVMNRCKSEKIRQNIMCPVELLQIEFGV